MATNRQFRITVALLALFVAGSVYFVDHLDHKNTKIPANPSIAPIVSGFKQAKAAEPEPVVTKSIEIVNKSLRVPVLMYHRVGIPPDAASMDLTVSPADFEAQVKYFKDLGYKTVSLQQVYDALTGTVQLPGKPIVFTFDDGYQDVFTNAVPILEKYGYFGTFAIATNLLGRPTYAVWDDVITAVKLGMEIVSHTENHLDLSNPIYSEADLHREIFDSKKILEQKLGTVISFFVYPYGKYNYHVSELLVQAGYKMAFSTAYGIYLNSNNLLAEPRVRVHGQNGLERLKLIFSPVPKPQTAPALTNP